MISAGAGCLGGHEGGAVDLLDLEHQVGDGDQRNERGAFQELDQ